MTVKMPKATENWEEKEIEENSISYQIRMTKSKTSRLTVYDDNNNYNRCI